MQRIAFISALIVMAVTVLFFTAPVTAQAGSIDNSIYARLLDKHVQGGLVDYKGLKADQAELEKYLGILAEVKVPALSENEAFAYFINVYNAWTLKLILDNYPGIDSIKDIGSFFKGPWSIEFVKLRNKTVTLDDVEHEIMRPRFQDPRLHFVVNCASMGCPRLHDAPFEAETLDATLDMLTSKNINDPYFNSFSNGELKLVKVFDWYGEDWGGEQDKIAFVRRYAKGELQRKLENWSGEIDVDYMDWNWALNDVN